MAQDNKILIIGLDGGTWKILRPMMDKGVMPNLKKLVDGGTSGILNSTLPALTPTAMASFQTGVRPDKHGIYEFSQYEPGTYKPGLVSSKSIRKNTIWKILSDAGKKIALVGVPVTYPPEQINGIVLSGLLTPSIESGFVYPSEFKRELLEHIGDYRIHTSPGVFPSKGVNKFLKELIYTEKKRTEAFEYISNKLECDISMIYFQSVDSLQHVLWSWQDPNNSDYSSEKFEKTAVFYKSIDDNIGKLLQLAGEHTNIIIMSDHGFGPLKKTLMANKFLESEGFLKIRTSFKAQALIKLVNLLKRIDFLKIRRVFLNIERRNELLGSVTYDVAIDWSKTTAYMPCGSQTGNIYINLEGREPEGIVTAKQYNQLREQLKTLFEALKDPEMGKPVIKQVYYREDVADVDFKSAPDILVESENGYLFGRGVECSRIWHNPVLGKQETGCHQKDGIYVFYGPDFRRGQGQAEIDIVDLPATILAMMGVEPPSYFDGEIMEFALKENIKKSRFTSLEETKVKGQGQAVYSNNDEEILQKRLKNLGYL